MVGGTVTSAVGRNRLFAKGRVQEIRRFGCNYAA